MKNILTVAISAVISVIIVLLLGSSNDASVLSVTGELNGKIPQTILSYGDTAHEYYRVYDGGELVGIISDKEAFDQKLEELYQSEYASDYPNTYMALAGDYYMAKEIAYYEVEDIDDEIFDHLLERDAFGIMTNIIDFSTDEGVYATIYVADMADFEEAISRFLNNFISESERTALSSSSVLDEMTEVGDRSIGYRIVETITTHTGVAKVRGIMMDADEVYEYFCYGDNVDRDFYTVQEGDTLQGVGYFNGDMSPEQIMMLNPNQIFSVDQILTPGMVLNVTYFTSPITVIVTKESLRLEDVYPEQTIVLEDSELYVGSMQTIQEEQTGSSYTLYEETWINGVLMTGHEVSRSIITQPIQGIVAVGAQQKPDVGTGSFRWPVENAHISNGWLGYSGHYALDLINRYERYATLYAADNGVVIEKSYDSISGNYIVIDHQNGFKTYYGHLVEPAIVDIGDTVMKGDELGTMGSTGLAYGVHVHFELRLDDVRINPCIYMNCEAIS